MPARPPMDPQAVEFELQDGQTLTSLYPEVREPSRRAPPGLFGGRRGVPPFPPATPAPASAMTTT